VRLSDLGEVKTIEIIKNLIIKKGSAFQSLKAIKTGIGDDCAVFKDNTIVTTDVYIEDIHFSLDYFNLYQIGQRVVCGTLSDIAAMAGKPTAIFVSALLPSKMTKKELKELYQGLLSITKRFNCEIAGGDIVAYPKLGLILTATGRASNPKLRSSAKPGDYLYVTGFSGLAETGRLALNHNLPKRRYPQSIKRHFCPIPRINEAQKLNKYINAMIDTSDGLSTDAFHLAEESNVKIVIDAEKIPIHNETVKLMMIKNTPSPRPSPTRGEEKGESEICANLCNQWLQNENIVLNGGEDYELLFTSKYKNLPQDMLGTKLNKIGIVQKGRGVFLFKDKKEIPLIPKGYDHFRI
jgi:thiamine-monophosphate kinase